MIYDIIDIDIDGAVDQAGLDRLRAHLKLTKRGRLTDDWDQTFGHRMIKRTAEQYTNIHLFRNDDGSWELSVTDTERRDPNDAAMASLRTELINGLIAAGYQPHVRANPTVAPDHGVEREPKGRTENY